MNVRFHREGEGSALLFHREGEVPPYCPLSASSSRQEGLKALSSLAMFFVRHHDDQVALFNAKCHTVVLSQFIKKTLVPAMGGAGVGAPVAAVALAAVAPASPVHAHRHIDLVPIGTDLKNVAPLGLPDKGDTIYANTFVQHRGSYALVTATDPDEDGIRDYALVWKKPGDESDKLAAALEARTLEERRKVGGKGGKPPAKSSGPAPGK
mgnify:CR=1 FL=1